MPNIFVLNFKPIEIFKTVRATDCVYLSTQSS